MLSLPSISFQLNPTFTYPFSLILTKSHTSNVSLVAPIRIVSNSFATLTTDRTKLTTKPEQHYCHNMIISILIIIIVVIIIIIIIIISIIDNNTNINIINNIHNNNNNVDDNIINNNINNNNNNILLIILLIITKILFKYK